MPETRRLREELARILFVIPTLRYGGTQSHLALLTKGLDRTKYSLTVCCVRSLGPMVREFQKSEIPVVCMDVNSVYNPLIAGKLERFLKSNQVDILHTYLFGFDLLTNMAARRRGIPIVISNRTELATWKKVHHRSIQRLANRFVDKIVANCEAVKSFCSRQEGLSPSKIVTIHNGVDLKRFDGMAGGDTKKGELGLAKGGPVVGMVANFDEVKGHRYLVKAMPWIRRAAGPVHFLFVGDGPVRRRIQDLAQREESSSSVIFTGFRRDIPEMISSMDVLVLPSLQEGFPNVILEAMAMGKPVVATSSGGARELVIDGETGLLVPPRQPQALADRLVFLLTNRQRAKAMGIAGRRRVEKDFSLHRMVRNYEKLYQNLLEEKRCG